MLRASRAALYASARGAVGVRGLALGPSSAYVPVGAIEVDAALKRAVDTVVMPGTGVAPDDFWRGFAAIATELAPRNRALLDERDALQRQIDDWHIARRGQPHDAAAYRAFLADIGYLIRPPAHAAPVAVRTAHVDPEIATIAGPQLVCPVDNARFIVNAANARWGSLLDALYGTNVVPGPRTGGYDKARGAAVWDEAHRTLDRLFPLDAGPRRAPAPPPHARRAPPTRFPRRASPPRLARRHQVGERALPLDLGGGHGRPGRLSQRGLQRARRPARRGAGRRLPRDRRLPLVNPSAQPWAARRARRRPRERRRQGAQGGHRGHPGARAAPRRASRGSRRSPRARRL